jgi:hypothetical protein
MLKKLFYKNFVLNHFLSKFQMYRRWIGGHWEAWWIDFPICSTIWIYCNHGYKPGGICSLEHCEDYSPKLERTTPYR